MDLFTATESSVLGPIRPNWTIIELVEWLSDDTRQHDPALRHPLALIEAAVTGAQWSGEPSTIALVRSLAAARRTHGALVIADLSAQLSPSIPLGGSGRDRPRDRNEQDERMPQVA